MKKWKQYLVIMFGLLMLADSVSVYGTEINTEVSEIIENDDIDETEDTEEDLEDEDIWFDYELYVDTDKWRLAPGETAELEVDTDAPLDEIVFESSNTEVATVLQDGTVTAISGGLEGSATVQITAKWQNPKNEFDYTYDSVFITVYNTITLNETNYTVYLNQKNAVYRLQATANPTGTVTWKSSDEKIATVDSQGGITPKKQGTVTITATANGVSASCFVTVSKPSLSLDSAATIYLKNPQSLGAVASPDAKIKWKSSNSKIVKVNAKGIVTGLKKGKATITATAHGITKKCVVTVESPSLYMYQNELSLVAGSTYQMYAFAKPEMATIKWKSSNKKIVKVDKNGLLTGVKPGKAKVTASINGAKVTCNVTIVKDIYNLNGADRTIITGEKINLYMSGIPSNTGVSFYQMEYNGVIEAQTQDNVCTITGRNVGKAQIMVSFSLYQDDKYVYYRKPCTINVVDSGISSQQFSIAKGTKKTLSLVNVGAEENIASVKWTTSSTKVAGINENTGEVTGKKKGSAKIKATVTYVDGTIKTYTADMKVSDPKASASTIAVAMQGNKEILLGGINDYSNMEWKSSKNSVVDITKSGVLIPKKKGTATVKGNIDGKAISVKVYVSNPSIKDNYSLLGVGKSKKISVKGLVSKSKVTYKSSNKKVATVSKKGVVKVKSGGRAEITIDADGKVFTYLVECASQAAIDARTKGKAIIDVSTYSQTLRMQDGYYDCSALVFKAYGRNSALLGGSSSWAPTAANMALHMKNTQKVISWKALPVEELRPGDLIFYGHENNGRYLGIYHVSMYYGNGYRLEKPMDYYWEQGDIVMIARPVP